MWRVQSVRVRSRGAGVEEITVRLDREFFSRATVTCLERLGMPYLLKVSDHHWVRRELNSRRRSSKSQEITKDLAVWIWSSSGTLYGGRLLSLEWRRTEPAEDALYETEGTDQRAHVLTNIPGLRALTACRRYNDGAVVEQRIEELVQIGAGRPAVDDLGATHCCGRWRPLPLSSCKSFAPSVFAGSWRSAQPDRPRTWLFRLPAKLIRQARKQYVQLPRGEPVRLLLLQALRRTQGLRAPPAPA